MAGLARTAWLLSSLSRFFRSFTQYSFMGTKLQPIRDPMIQRGYVQTLRHPSAGSLCGFFDTIIDQLGMFSLP